MTPLDYDFLRRRLEERSGLVLCGDKQYLVKSRLLPIARKAGLGSLAPHDLRRTCARLCHVAGGELEQIQFLLGHVSAQTTEKYLGCKQRLREAVNDHIGIEPSP